jgi:signal transduction histidine kinase
METVDIRGEFEDTVFMYSNRLSEEGITLHYVDDEQDIPEITCDPKRLRQVFLNILNNAVKHGGDGKRVDASIVYRDDYVIVRVRDYGPGIPEDELSLVKKKFYKGSSKSRGSGIGLAVSDEIVQMHGGELILENAVGGGTLVTVRLPATQ